MAHHFETHFCFTNGPCGPRRPAMAEEPFAIFQNISNLNNLPWFDSTCYSQTERTGRCAEYAALGGVESICVFNQFGELKENINYSFSMASFWGIFPPHISYGFLYITYTTNCGGETGTKMVRHFQGGRNEGRGIRCCFEGGDLRRGNTYSHYGTPNFLTEKIFKTIHVAVLKTRIWSEWLCTEVGSKQLLPSNKTHMSLPSSQLPSTFRIHCRNAQHTKNNVEGYLGRLLNQPSSPTPVTHIA